MSQPRIKLLRGPSSTKGAAAVFATSGLASVFSALSRAANLVRHDEQGLQVYLHNRIAIARQASRRSAWIGGRIFNRFSGEDPDYIQLSGTHLGQVLPLAGIDTPDVIAGSGEYLLRLDIAQKALDILEEKNGVLPPMK